MRMSSTFFSVVDMSSAEREEGGEGGGLREEKMEKSFPGLEAQAWNLE